MQADYVKVRYLDVMVYPGKTMIIPTASTKNVFSYIVEGNGSTGDSQSAIDSRMAVLFTDGEQLVFTAGNEGLRMLVVSGDSLNEPISWGGPIVMNTREELDFAFEELDRGTFIKHQPAH